MGIINEARILQGEKKAEALFAIRSGTQKFVASSLEITGCTEMDRYGYEKILKIKLPNQSNETLFDEPAPHKHSLFSIDLNSGKATPTLPTVFAALDEKYAYVRLAAKRTFFNFLSAQRSERVIRIPKADFTKVYAPAVSG